MGPYQATGSPMGLPETSRNLTASASVETMTSIAVAKQDQHLVAHEGFPFHVEVVEPLHFMGKRVLFLAEVPLALNDVGEHGVAPPGGMAGIPTAAAR